MLLNRRAIAGLLPATLLAGCATPTAGPASGPSLDALARAKGLRFGSTLGSLGRTSRFHDRPYRDLTARECGVLVAENETKWQQLRPDAARPDDFAPADEMFAWAEGQGMTLRGHCLLWMDPKWLPVWVNALPLGARDAEAARQVLGEHIRSTCTHFGGRLESWDVVNEAITPETGELRANVFSAPFGGGHEGGVAQIDFAFRAARVHAPSAQLVYNDFMSWGGGQNIAHRAGVLRLLTELKRRGTPVQALGIQGHIGAEPRRERDVAEWRRFLDEVMALDLDLLVTEFDVNDNGLPADTARRDAEVAAAARDWLDVTLAAPRLRRLLCWGLSDRHSWLQDYAPRPDRLPKRVLPYDEHLAPKPLRIAIAEALRATPAR